MGLGHALVVATNLVPKQMWRCMLRVDTSVSEGFSCPTFQLLCPNRKSLRNHMTRKHSQNPKKPQLSVNFCWWRNFFSLELDCLVNSKMNKYSEGHGSGTVWRCTDCGYKSKYKTNVSEHVESRHVQLTWAVCNYAVQCVLIGRLCAIMSQKWKQARQRVWQNYHWKVALNLVLAHCFFLELESYIVSKMSKLTSNRKADLLRLGGGVTGQEGLKLVFWTKITPFHWRKFCLLLSAHSSAKDSQVHNLLRTRAWTRHWRWSVLTVESVAKGFQVGGSWNNTSPNVGRAQV